MVRRIWGRHGTGQEVRADNYELGDSYSSRAELPSWTAVTGNALGRITTTISLRPWSILAQAAGFKLDKVERSSFDPFRALEPEQRETILKGLVRRRSPRSRHGRTPSHSGRAPRTRSDGGPAGGRWGMPRRQGLRSAHHSPAKKTGSMRVIARRFC